MNRLRAILLVALLLPTAWATPVTTTEGTWVEASLYLEEFQDPALPLAARGWSTQTLAGARPPYKLVEEASAFGGAGEGRGWATIANGTSGYPARLDARLVSPVYDLRHVAGAPLPGLNASGPRATVHLLDALANVTSPLTENLSGGEDAIVALDAQPAFDASNGTLVWPPEALDRRVNASFLAPPNASNVTPPRASVADPEAPEGVGRARLTVEHAWSFSPGDGLWIEARVRDEEGSWSGWMPIAPASGTASWIRAPHILPASGLAVYNGALADGTAAFTGASGGVVTTELALERFAGTLVQIAFHVRADSPLPPDSFGHALDRVELRAQLADVDVAIEGFAPLDEGALVASGTWLAPRVHVRNWGALPALNVTVTASLHVGGLRAPGSPVTARVDLAPGELRAIELPGLRAEGPANATLAAQILTTGLVRPDVRRDNDRMSVDFRIASEPRVALTLVVPPGSAITGIREEKRLLVEAVNLGTAPAIGTLSLEARTPGASAKVVSARDIALPAAGAIVSGRPELDATPFELAWRPDERGEIMVGAAFGSSRSPVARVWVDLSPPPLQETRFASQPDPLAAFDEREADGLEGWSFMSWSAANGSIVADPPAAPSPRRMLVARPVDDLGRAEIDAAQETERSTARMLNVSLVLPTRAATGEPSAFEQGAAVNASYARLLLLANASGCPCEDLRDRVPLLAPLLNASLAQENITLAKGPSSFAVNDTTIALGSARGEILFIALNVSVAPGLALQYAPLVLRRSGNDSAPLLPASPPMPYDEDGAIRCCLLGPYSSADVLELVELAHALGGTSTTQTATMHTIARPLDDLLAGLPAGELALVLASQTRLPAGARAIAEIEPADALPPELRATLPGAIALEGDHGWTSLVLPLDRTLDSPRLRLTLVANASEPTGPCPILAGNATCEVPPAWYVDELRLAHRAARELPWRVVARDDLEREGLDPRWGGMGSTQSRGWALASVPREPAHSFELHHEGAPRDGEPETTRALAWERTRADGPSWSVARLPPVELANATAPFLSLATRFDLGPQRNGTYSAGAALVALAEWPDGTRSRRLLEPSSGLDYGGHVSAPVFDELARALRIAVPRGAPASALVGRAEEWTILEADLQPLRGASRVWIEIHLVSAGAGERSFELDDVRIGERGPAHDAAIVGLPSLPPGVAIGRGVATPISVGLADLGLFGPREARVEAWIVDPLGNVSYGPHDLTLAGIAPEGAEVVLPPLWTPVMYGRHVLHARVSSSPADERIENDAVRREIEVRDELGGSILPDSPGLVGAARPAPGAALALEARLRNNGTLPLGGPNAARLALQVYDGTTPLLATPVRADVAALLGRALRPGETAALRLANAWTPPRSGVFRVEIGLELPAIAAAPISLIERTLRVEEALAAPALRDLVPVGDGWTNASASSEPAAWTFVAEGEREGSLATPAPIELRGAASATLSLTHRRSLEEGFDAGVVEARLPGGAWFTLTPAGGYPASALAPSPLVARGSIERPAFTGAAGTITSVFDLGANAELRERVTLLDASRGETLGAVESWLGPAGEGELAASGAPPASVPESAVGYERVDSLRFRVEIPSDATGPIALRLDDWRAFGDHADEDLPASGARVRMVVGQGEVHEGTFAGREARVADWTAREVRFPTAPTLAGRTIELLVEHVEVFARNATGLASGTGSLHYGYAVRALALTTGSSGNALASSEPARSSEGRWLHEDGSSSAAPAAGGFEPIVAESVWTFDGLEWTARPSARVPDARIAFPLDLRLAVGRVELALEASHDPGAAGTRVEVSADRGRSWTRVDEEARRVDLSPYAGMQVLVGLRARFAPDAPDDDRWTLHAARIEAEIFRGDSLDVRLRAASDADGARGTWEIVDLTTSVVRHGRGLGVRLIEPDEGPITAGFRTLLFEVVNRGAATSLPTTLSILVTDPAERGGRTHGANRTVPALAPGTSAMVPVRGADLNWFLAASASPSRVEARVASNDDTFRADNALLGFVGGANVLERPLVTPVALNVTPQALVMVPNKTPTVGFVAWVENAGEDAATLGPSILRIWRDDVNVRNLTNAIPSGGRIMPGQAQEIAWSWKPDASLPRGSYRAEAEIVTTTARGPVVRSVNATFLVADAYLGGAARIERFGDAEPAWTCVSASPCGREETASYRSAPASLAVGVATAGLGASGARSVIASPELPLNATLGGTLRLYARHAFLPAQSASVLAAEVFVNGSVGAFGEVGRLAGRSAGYDEGRFVEASFAVAASEHARGILVRLDAPTPANASAPALLVDDVSLTPLDASWRAPARVSIADGVRKSIRLEARNNGAMTDTFVVSLRDGEWRPLSLPPGWSAEVVDAATGRVLASSSRSATAGIAIPANGTRALDLVVVAPATAAGAPLRGPVPIALSLNATLLPDLSRTLRLDLRSQALARSDVGILQVEVRGASDPPGRARTVEVALTNRGLAPALAALRATAYAPDGVEEAPELLAGVDGETDPSVALAPGARKTATFVWTPRHAGLHRLVVSLDPAGALREADTSDHVLERLARVSPLAYPDLRVDLDVDVDGAFLGRAVPVGVNVTNLGGAAARDVEVSLRAGVVDLLPQGSPHLVGDVDPGATRTLRATWTPSVPGNATILATAFSRAGLSELVETLDDNARVRVAFVREPTARLEPAGDAGAFTLTNGGNANETYLLRASVPDGWSYAIRVDAQRATRIELAPNASARLVLEPFVPPGTLAGPRELVLEAVSASTGESRRAPWRFEVAPRHALGVTLIPSEIDPRDPYVELLLENDGNLRETVAFEPRALPDGWRLVGTSASVDPGKAITARLGLDLGAADEPRAVRVGLGWRSGAAQGEVAGTVHVAVDHALTLALEGEAGAGHARPAAIVVRNGGNLVERGVLRLELPEGFATDLDGRAIALGKGEATRIEGWIAAPPNASATARATISFEGDERVGARARIDVVQHDLRLAWDPEGIRGPGEPARESIAVENVGTAPAENATVTLFVDGTPVASREIGTLQPGDTVDLALAWTPAPGIRAVLLVARTLDGSADATPHDNARAASWDVSPPGSPIAAAAARAESPAPAAALVILLAAAVALLGRRRS